MLLNATTSVLLIANLEMLHENSDDDVDENKLSHKNKDDEEHRGVYCADAAVLDAIIRGIAVVILQCILSSN